MNDRTVKLATVLFLLLPAFGAGAHRLIERNGSLVTERIVVSVSVPSDGIVVVVPDALFSDGFERY